MAMKRTEADIKRAIVQYLRMKGCLVIPYRSVGIVKPNGKYIPMPRTGISDLLGLDKNGKFFAIEVKRPGEPRPDHQERFLQEVRSHGCVGIFATSIEDVMGAGL